MIEPTFETTSFYLQSGVLSTATCCLSLQSRRQYSCVDLQKVLRVGNPVLCPQIHQTLLSLSQFQVENREWGNGGNTIYRNLTQFGIFMYFVFNKQLSSYETQDI